MRFTQNPSYLSSKDITPVVMGQVNYVYLDKFHAEPSYLSSKDITPVVMGQVNYVYLDKIHAEPLVSLLKRHPLLGLRCNRIVKYSLHHKWRRLEEVNRKHYIMSLLPVNLKN
jgi:hypothetical protein